MQSKKFTGCEPIFLAGIEHLARLADDLKLVVTKKFLQGTLDPVQFRRDRLRLRDIFRDDESAPNCLRALQLWRCAHNQPGKSGDERERTTHERLVIWLRNRTATIVIPQSKEPLRDPLLPRTSRWSHLGLP